jgi:hypothetical protein
MFFKAVRSPFAVDRSNFHERESFPRPSKLTVPETIGITYKAEQACQRC